MKNVSKPSGTRAPGFLDVALLVALLEACTSDMRIASEFPTRATTGSMRAAAACSRARRSRALRECESETTRIRHGDRNVREARARRRRSATLRATHVPLVPLEQRPVMSGPRPTRPIGSPRLRRVQHAHRRRERVPVRFPEPERRRGRRSPRRATESLPRPRRARARTRSGRLRDPGPWRHAASCRPARAGSGPPTRSHAQRPATSYSSWARPTASAMLLWDASVPVVAAVHAGWRGRPCRSAVPRAVTPARPDRSRRVPLRAALGPRIGPAASRSAGCRRTLRAQRNDRSRDAAPRSTSRRPRSAAAARHGLAGARPPTPRLLARRVHRLRRRTLRSPTGAIAAARAAPGASSPPGPRSRHRRTETAV